MDAIVKPTCRLVRPHDTYDGKQGFSYVAGIASETVGSQGICMHLLTVPPGGRAKAHKHESHETAIYVLSGEVHTWYGERLENHVVTRAGDAEDHYSPGRGLGHDGGRHPAHPVLEMVGLHRSPPG